MNGRRLSGFLSAPQEEAYARLRPPASLDLEPVRPDYTAPGLEETHVFIEVHRNRDPERFIAGHARSWVEELESLKDEIDDPAFKREILNDLLRYYVIVSGREIDLEKFNVQESTKRVNARVKASRPEKESQELHLHQHDHQHGPDLSGVSSEDLTDLMSAMLRQVREAPAIDAEAYDIEEEAK